jgi:hypothetical protein
MKRKLTKIDSFDSFDNPNHNLNDNPNNNLNDNPMDENLNYNPTDEIGYNPDTDNSIVARLMRDYGFENLALLEGLLKRFFPNYNSNLPISENVNAIYARLKSEQSEGQELSNFEKTFIEIMERAKAEIEVVRENQTKKAIMENLPFVFIAALVIFFIGKKL